MGSRGQWRAVLIGLALASAGAALTEAWRHTMWGSVTGAVLVVLWLLALLWAAGRETVRGSGPERVVIDGEEIAPLRLLLDQMPTPLVEMEGERARALNRAARSLFATQDRIVPVPPSLLVPSASRMLHAGRHWRIDRIEAGGASGAPAILALIDIEAEERTGEARAAAEMIQVMGHELLNGLAPIVSLAESGLAVWEQKGEGRERLMPEILATLARRAESLQRFTEGYRALARLPDPAMTPISAGDLLNELAILFEGHWQARVALRVDQAEQVTTFLADRDQLTQALWALLQNAAEAALAGPEAPWVALSITPEEGRCAILISDSGSGVPSAQRARIFHPFHTTKPDGTGIGLSLGRHIARAHGGDLQLLTSRPTTFLLTVPRPALSLTD